MYRGHHHIRDDGLHLIESALPYAQYSNLVAIHLQHFQYSKELEQAGANLCALEFPEEQTRQFVRSVCIWGSFAGLGTRIIRENSVVEIQTNFRNVIRMLDARSPDPYTALMEICYLRGLGKPVFASRYLRYLRPDLCHVWGCIVTTEFYGTVNPKLYGNFSGACRKIADNLQRESIYNPMQRENNRWFAADVEMALFAYFKNLS